MEAENLAASLFFASQLCKLDAEGKNIEAIELLKSEEMNARWCRANGKGIR